MRPTVQVHNIESFKMTEPKQLKTDSGHEFSTRELVFTDSKGERFTISLFSDRPDGVLTQEEKQAATVDKMVEAARAIPDEALREKQQFQVTIR